MAGAVLATPAWLAACGDDKATSTTSTGAAASKPTGRVDFLGFEGDEGSGSALKQWYADNKITLKTAFVAGGAPDIVSKFQGGGGKGIDVVSLPSAWGPTISGNGSLISLDEARIENVAKLLPQFKGLDEFTRGPDGKRYAVPFQWAPGGITHDTKALPEVSSFEALMDPSLKGRIIMLDAPLFVLDLAAMILKLDPTKLPKARFGEVEDLLRKVVKQSKTVAPSVGDAATLLGSGEAVALWGGYPVLNGLAGKQAKGKTFKTSYTLDEGTIIFLQMFGIGNEADNADAAYAYINEMLDPEVNAQVISDLDVGTVVDGAAASVSAANSELYDYDNLDGIFEGATFVSNPPATSDEFVTLPEFLASWQSIKVGS